MLSSYRTITNLNRLGHQHVLISWAKIVNVVPFPLLLASYLSDALVPKSLYDGCQQSFIVAHVGGLGQSIWLTHVGQLPYVAVHVL